MDEFAEDEFLARSIRRSKDAYNRIKMNLSLDGPCVGVQSKYKEPVQRIQQVVEVLGGIEEAKVALSVESKTDSPERRLEEYRNIKEIVHKLKAHRKTDLIYGILGRLGARAKSAEAFLDDFTKKQLALSLQGKSHDNWAEFMVNKKDKTGLFLDLAMKYMETIIKQDLGESSGQISQALAEIEILARVGLEPEQAAGAAQKVARFSSDVLVHEMGKKCYSFIKSICSPIKKLQEYVQFLGVLITPAMEGVLRKNKIHEKIQKIAASTYKTLYKEAEEYFVTGKINEKRLFDRDLFYLLKALQGVVPVSEFLGVSVRMRRKVKEFGEVSKQKSKQAGSKWEGLIFLLNSTALLNSTKKQKVPTDKIAQEAVQEMSGKLRKAVENPDRTNKVGELLRAIEKTLIKAKHYSVPEEHRPYIISEYKKTVREIGNAHGGLDNVSDSHLSATIEGFFNGPTKKLSV
ncbi:uncharacterized protein NEMAJ01_0915 [Nematocida major]|uniref:uncharacterized protein n=1 Tax=Nematocida major TaxID=1912982 RepID=UPI0020078FDD|nr:uncharacterized protein NEMAJ01_0915 [Nematocida major]KAH9386019.1 hypothetical protein NEMAJ01_0915 [Nematocida major]